MAANNPVNKSTVHIIDCIDMDEPVQSHAISLALQNIGMGTVMLLSRITKGMQERFNLTMLAYANNQQIDYSLEGWICERNLLLFSVGDNLEILMYEVAPQLPHAPQVPHVQHPPAL